jgi:hypothetical protein
MEPDPDKSRRFGSRERMKEALYCIPSSSTSRPQSLNRYQWNKEPNGA